MASWFQRFELAFKYLELVSKYKKTLMLLFGSSVIANIVSGNMLITKEDQINAATYALKIHSETISELYREEKPKPPVSTKVELSLPRDVLKRLEWLEAQH